MNNKITYTLFGLFVGLGVPSIRLLWRAYVAKRDWWEKWITQEITHHGDVYLFLSIIGITVFSIVGYWIGKRHDDLEIGSKSIENENMALTHLASTDALTGLFNARYIREQLEIELENSYQRPLTCILADLDHFKQINDQHGHAFGDQVLIHVSQLLKKSVRRVDVVGRLGGEEFVVILPGLPANKALDISERIRKTIETSECVSGNSSARITVSLGVVTYPKEGINGKEDLLKAADDALYKAKRNGRNCVVVWPI